MRFIEIGPIKISSYLANLINLAQSQDPAGTRFPGTCSVYMYTFMSNMPPQSYRQWSGRLKLHED